MNNKDVLIWLSSIKGIGSKTIHKLEKYYGSLLAVWEAKKDSISKIDWINDKVKEKLINTKNNQYVANIKERILNLCVKVITIYDEDYPENLKNIYDPPKLIYVKGNLIPEDNLSIGLVGSRKATSYGKWAAQKFAKELSSLGITIVSGMAKGIDTCSHKSTLSESGRTIAVLGSGVNVIYPISNKELYNNIVENGAVISEFPLDMEPFPQNFPQRNRIISGLTLGVIVIEAGEKSGSLITAEYALEQGRDVFALPGNINSIYSKGTNKLIKEGAILLTDIDDILNEIQVLKEKIKIKNKSKIDYGQLGHDEVKILKCIEEYPMHCDNIALKTGMNISQINGILTILEMKGLVKQLSGKIFTIN